MMTVVTLCYYMLLMSTSSHRHHFIILSEQHCTEILIYLQCDSNKLPTVCSATKAADFYATLSSENDDITTYHSYTSIIEQI